MMQTPKERFIIDQSIVARKDMIPNIFNFVTPKRSTVFGEGILSEEIEWYPNANIFYPFTEDADAFTRAQQLVALRSDEPSTLQAFDRFDPDIKYYEDDAQLHYLSEPPVSFIVIGKPGIGQQILGQKLAEYWQAIYLDPEVLIRDEIFLETRAGKCIEYNLQCGRSIGVEVILRLLQKRLNSETCRHRGVVLADFPLIPNNLYTSDPVSTESAIFTAQEIIEELLEELPRESSVTSATEVTKNVSKTSLQEEEPSAKTPKATASREKPDVGPDQDVFSSLDDHDIKSQIDFIFSLFDKPLVVVYMVCSNNDVILKHNLTRYDYKINEIVNLLREPVDKTLYTVYSRIGQQFTEIVPTESFINIRMQEEKQEIVESMYLIKLPSDFLACVAAQLEAYRFKVLPYVENHIMEYGFENFIRVDARQSYTKTFNGIRSRLRIMNLQPVIIPQRVDPQQSKSPRGMDVEEEEEEQTFEIGNKTPEECFPELRKLFTINPMFKWQLSHWGYSCPVTLAKTERYVVGNPHFCVRFMNKIFFLANEEACKTFIRNPRPFLLPPNPKSKNRIFVMGPMFCGKTSISQALSVILQTEYLNPAYLEKEFREMKRREIIDNVRNLAVANALKQIDLENAEEYEAYLQELYQKIKQWKKEIVDRLEKYLELLDDYELNAYSPFPLKTDTDAQDPIDELKEILLVEGISFVESQERCKDAIINPSILDGFLPLMLQKRPPPEPASIDDPFVEEAVQRALQSTNLDITQISDQDYIEMFVSAINKLDMFSNNGWVLDGMPPITKVFEELKDQCANTVILFDIDEKTALDVFKKAKADRESNQLSNFLGFLNTIKDNYPSLFMNVRTSIFLSFNLEEKILEVYSKWQSLVNQIVEPNFDCTENEFLERFRNFRLNMSEIRNFCDANQITIYKVELKGKTLNEVLLEAILFLVNRHRLRATVMTEEDKYEEMKSFGAGVSPEEGEEPGEDDYNAYDALFEMNRRYGETYNYCPVLFDERFLLWKGKEQFAANYCERTYLMADEQCLKKFISNPRKYLPAVGSLKKFPPPRICIVGPTGSGKSTLAMSLVRNLGVFYCNFGDMLLKYLGNPCQNISDLNEITLESLTSQERRDSLVAIQNYVRSRQPLPESIIANILYPLWMEPPTFKFGFILEGFPKTDYDANCMLRNYFVPDAVIQLDANEKFLVERCMDKFHETMDEKIRERQEVRRKEYERTLEKWQAERDQRIKVMIAENYSETNLTDLDSLSARSIIVRSNIDLNKLHEALEAELPMPVMQQVSIADFSSAMQYETNIQNAIASETKSLQPLKEIFQNVAVPYAILDASSSLKSLFIQSMYMAEPLKFRPASLLERTYDVTIELAEWLLNNGSFFLSKFGRLCPVHVLENPSPVSMFLPFESRLQMYPMIHRHCIYFVSSREHRDKFKGDPLKYVNNIECNIPLLPMKLAIIGPPKSGKSTLADRFKHEYGVKVITRGSAIRFVLKNMTHTDLYHKIERVLSRGQTIPTDLVIQAVQALTFDFRCLTQGFVFDGFPNSQEEMTKLAELSLLPYVIIDLKRDLDEVLKTCSDFNSKAKNIPPFSKAFITHLYDQWAKTAKLFRNWVFTEYQNLHEVETFNSKWCVWYTARNIVFEKHMDIQSYTKFRASKYALRLESMCINPYEFLLRRSEHFKEYCPCCLYYANTLTNGGRPPNRKGLVQYGQFYYWICPEHIEQFLKTPSMYVYPANSNTLPPDLPMEPDEKMTKNSPTQNGLCIVCFAQSKGKFALVPGREEFAVAYKELLFWFCSKECQKIFCKDPHDYFGVDARIYSERATSMTLDLNSLPVIGYLEQTVAKYLVKSCLHSGRSRPVIPGLSITQSALINIGLYLKVNNPNANKEFSEYYEEGYRKFNSRKDALLMAIENTKRRNPILGRKIARISRPITSPRPYPQSVLKMGLRGISTTSFDSGN